MNSRSDAKRLAMVNPFKFEEIYNELKIKYDELVIKYSKLTDKYADVVDELLRIKNRYASIHNQLREADTVICEERRVADKLAQALKNRICETTESYKISKKCSCDRCKALHPYLETYS